MRLKFVLGAVLVLVLHEVCSQGQFEPTNNDNLDVVANSVTNLAQKISRAIASPKSKTEIFSPVSIAGALSLLLLGSSGVTRDELTKLMGFDSQQINFADIHKSFGKLFRELVSPEPSLNTPIPWRQNDKCNNYDYEDEEPSPPPKNQRGKRDASSHQISVANGVFVDQNFQLGARYESLTKCLYQGSARRLPFSVDPRQTAQQINLWAQEATNGKIREIVTPDQVQNAPMVLASALYFKGKWETMFVEPDTRPRPFYVNGRNRAPVNVTSMATSGCFPYIDVKNWDAKIVGLPYQQGLSTMYLVVPNNSDRQKMRTLLDNINIDQLNRLIDQMQVKTGSVVMPKMQLENNLELKQILSKMGISTLFDPYKSDLSVIVNTVNDQDGDYGKSCQQNDNPEGSTINKITSTTPRPNTVFQSSLPRPIQSAEPYNPPKRIMNNLHTVDITEIPFKECYFIRNCNSVNNVCTCNIDSADAFEQDTCPTRPFYVARDCADKILSTETWALCGINQNQVDTNSVRQCKAWGCTYFNKKCHCCNRNLPVSTTSSPPRQQYPQNPIPQQQAQPTPFEIGTRIENDTPGQNSRQPPSRAPSPNNNNYPPTSSVGQQQIPVYTDQRQDPQYSQNNFQQQPPVPTAQVPVTSNHNQNSNPTRPQPEQRPDPYYTQNNFQQQSSPQAPQTPAFSNQNYNPNSQPPISITCVEEPKCDYQQQRCWSVRKCFHTVNVGRSRSKRQANRSPLFVGDIVHKVSLDIDESGTEGGAVTAVVIDRISSSFTLRLDGPFLIYLRHDITKLPLFYGPVYDPRD